MAEKLCERCGEVPATRFWRHCRACRKILIKELEQDGYLHPKPTGHVGQQRSTEARELTRETKFGVDR